MAVMSTKNANQPEKKETDKLTGMLKDVVREIHEQMKWTREDSDPAEQKFWLRMTIYYCEDRIRHLSGSK